jgi:hypothetical protein
MTPIAVLSVLKSTLGNRALLSLRELRAALPSLTRTEQDDAIEELEAAGLVALHYDDAALLRTATEREPYIRRGRVWYHAIARRRVA